MFLFPLDYFFIIELMYFDLSCVGLVFLIELCLRLPLCMILCMYALICHHSCGTSTLVGLGCYNYGIRDQAATCST